jgi:hypothetical protein
MTGPSMTELVARDPFILGNANCLVQEKVDYTPANLTRHYSPV